MSTFSDQPSFTVTTASGHYAVAMGPGLAGAEVAEGRVDAIVTDERFVGHFDGVPVVAVEAAEENKTLSGVEDVIVGLRTAGVRRADRVLVVGGGIVQDIGTLACALFMRGVGWSYAPTTLMAMTDSCIGGKSSINARHLKNLIGNIYPPDRVIIDTEFTRTLGTIDFVSGLAEAVKICFCRGVDEFDDYLRSVPTPIGPAADFGPVIARALRSKKWFIEIDEFDRAERQQLNFGHTFGHALEAATDFRVPHGVAVAVGMVAACDFAGRPGASPRLRGYLVALLGEVHELDRLTGVVDWAKFRAAFDGDKKHGRAAYRLVLPDDGGVHVADVPLNDQTLDEVERAVQSALDETTGVSR